MSGPVCLWLDHAPPSGRLARPTGSLAQLQGPLMTRAESRLTCTASSLQRRAGLTGDRDGPRSAMQACVYGTRVSCGSQVFTGEERGFKLLFEFADNKYFSNKVCLELKEGLHQRCPPAKLWPRGFNHSYDDGPGSRGWCLSAAQHMLHPSTCLETYACRTSKAPEFMLCPVKS